jgi:hypothetical protein
MTANRLVRQAVLVEGTGARENQLTEYLALVNEDGTPIVGVTFEDVPTGADVVLTGYVTGAWSAVSAADTVNGAIAKLANFRVGSNILLTGYSAGAWSAVAATDNVNEAIAKVANFRVGSNIVLTGYSIGVVALAALAAGDTVNAAFAKLEKRIADLEAA